MERGSKNQKQRERLLHWEERRKAEGKRCRCRDALHHDISYSARIFLIVVLPYNTNHHSQIYLSLIDYLP